MVCPTISEWQGRKTTLSPCKHEKQNQQKSGETRRPSVFHEIPRAAGPVQQTTKNDRLRHLRVVTFPRITRITVRHQQVRHSSHWKGPIMNTFWQDLRYGICMLWNSPWFTAASDVCLALGVRAAT